MVTDLTPERRGTINVPSLDGFRGLAVLWIVLGHCWHALGGRATLDGGSLFYIYIASYFGVDLLFIVSGFVLFLPAALRNGDIGDRRTYAVRRAARIVPGFYAAMIFTYVVARYIGVVKDSAGHWFSHLLFLHQPAHDLDHVGFGINGAMWTMSVEVVFYALLPFVAAWYFRHPLTGLVGAIAISQSWNLLAHKLPVALPWAGITWAGVEDGQNRMVHAFPTYIAHFAIGMTAAWLYVTVREKDVWPKPRTIVSAGAAASFIALIALAHYRGLQGALDRGGPFDHTGKNIDRALIFGCLVLTTALASTRTQWIVRNPVSRFLGTRSYGFYLSHTPLIYLMITMLGLEKFTSSNLDLLKLVVAVVVSAVAVGALSFAFLEEPFRRWARRVRRPPEQVAPGAPPVALASTRA